jgi:hypothetical protein
VDNQAVSEGAGCITPEEAGMRSISNNFSELLAAVRGMESLPAGWSGTIYTDSMITQRRIVKRGRYLKRAKMNGIPEWLRDQTDAAKSRLGAFRVVLLAGHPTRKDLARGCREDGLPVSKWNVMCDRMCGVQAKNFWASNKGRGLDVQDGKETVP